MSLKFVKIDDLPPGSRLGEEVKSSQEIVLAKKDQLLDVRLIQVLKSFGVNQVRISEEGDRNVSPAVSIDLKQVELIKKRFRNLDLKSVVIKQLFELCVERLFRDKTSKS